MTNRNFKVKNGLDVSGDVVVSGTVDGRDVATDGTKLDGIATGANVGIGSLAADDSPQLGGVLDVNGQAIDFGDDEYLRLGDNNEHRIYHKGSGSALRLEATSAGKSIEVRGGPSSNSFFSVLDANGTNIIKATMDGTSSGVTLHHGGGTKLATSSSGVTVTGTLEATAVTGDGSGLTNLPAQSDSTKMPLAGGTFTGDVSFGDNDKAIFGAGSDLKIYHDGSNSVIEDAGTGLLRIQTGQLYVTQDDGTTPMFATSSGASVIYYNGSSRLMTTNAGAQVYGTLGVTGTVDGRDVAVDGTKLDGIATGANVGIATTGGSFTGDVSFGEDDKATFGANDDLEIYHDGTHHIIDAGGTGILRMYTDQLYLASKDNQYIGLVVSPLGSTTLYKSGVSKLTTTTNGVQIMGNLVVTGTVDGRDIAQNIPSSFGTAGQVLTVNEAENATEWVDASGGGGGTALILDTTNATATALTFDGAAASAANQIVAASDTAITFDGTITALQNGAQSYGSWKIEGLLVNDGGTTTLVNSVITTISNPSNWGISLSADNTNNALSITATGEASHNIRWGSTIRTTEVTYS